MYGLSYAVLSILLTAIFFSCETVPHLPESAALPFIQVSKENPNYFTCGNGKAYIPIGINMINPSGRFHSQPDSAFIEIESWMKNLSENGGNYLRIWLSASFWDIEKEAGHFKEEKAKRIDRYFALARKYGLYVKLTFEHFRSVTLEENPQQWATKFAYHTSSGGPLDSIRQYLISDAGKQLFTDKLDYYQQRYGNDTLFFGLELWNEMDAMKGPEDSVFFAWNERMLAETKSRFPSHLVMQSLGSFDTERKRPTYKRMMELPGNEVAQIHRYLDLGAEMEICHGPMDLIASSAIEEIRSYHTGKPVLLAETGAVEPRHSGPSKYYEKDTAGILLHDLLFAPFFAGSAGVGMSWHWESYVHKNNLWYHYQRFKEAIRGIDPIEEAFTPARRETDLLRIYQLKGNRTNLLWLRDKSNNWKSELEEEIPPPMRKAIRLTHNHLDTGNLPEHINVYDPWKNQWSTITKEQDGFTLPDFQRSLVVKFDVVR
ncbi:MAG: hypothetical protein KDC80_22635 [Saprospiraceae bacterium]|nr:hypothetical protein [Saprospiraceae bacterium]